jgi:PAS domain S-box-containing protein
VLTFFDITERKRAEEALRASEEQFRRAIEEAPIPVIMHAEDGEVLQISRSWTELTGYTLADVPTVDARLNYAYGPGADVVQTLFVRDQRSVNVSFDIRTRAGELRHWSFSASSPGTLRDGRRFVVGMALDITERTRVERALAEQARLLDLSNDAIIVRDIHNRIRLWNRGASELYGWSREEALGQDLHTLLRTEFEAPFEELIARLQEHDRMEGEVVQVARDGRRITALCRWALDRDAEGRPGAILTTTNDITLRKQAEAALAASNTELERRVQERTAALAASNQNRQELLRQLVTAQEEERLRIARDLHDQLGQQITGLLLGLKQLEAPLEGTPLAAQLPPLQGLAMQLAKDAHRLAVNLRPTGLDDVGLVAALKQHAKGWTAQTGIAVGFHSRGLKQGRLPQVLETTFFRAVQEALTNVQKHAAARTVSVLLERRDNEVVAIVEDDGRGYDPDAAPAGQERPRLGVRGMRERLAQVGGTLEIESSPGSGTTVFMSIPLDEQSSHGSQA